MTDQPSALETLLEALTIRCKPEQASLVIPRNPLVVIRPKSALIGSVTINGQPLEIPARQVALVSYRPAPQGYAVQVMLMPEQMLAEQYSEVGLERPEPAPGVKVLKFPTAKAPNGATFPAGTE
jgi:hypothetical protein